MSFTWIFNFVLQFAPEWVRKVVTSAVVSYTAAKNLPLGGELISLGDPGYYTDPNGSAFELRVHFKRIK